MSATVGQPSKSHQMPPIRSSIGPTTDRTKTKASQAISSSVIKRDMMTKNQYNLPTYFQLGRNSIEVGDRPFVGSNEQNRGLVGSVTRGKRQHIPVAANILTRQDSAERLNLKPSNPKIDSPSRRLLAKMRLEERSFKETFEGRRLPDNRNSNDRQTTSLLSKK